MANPKNYKNVYTILEKVKKGEIETHYKDKEGLFGKINFYKKPDLVKPYLHYIDEWRLENIMDSHMRDSKIVNEAYTKFSKTTDFKKIDPNKAPNSSDFYTKFQENYKKFPKHMAKDVFKMYYNQIQKLDFEERDEKNHTKFKFLERANNPVGKIMSEHSNLKSAIYARNIMAYFIARMTIMDYVDPNASQDIKNGLNGQSDFDNENVDEAMKDMMDSKQGKSMLDDAIQKAQELCKEMDNVMDDEVQEQLFENANKPGDDGGIAGKLSPDYLRQIASRLENISLSMGSLKEKIKKLLDKSVSYFSSNQTTEYEDLFNSDNVAGLEDYELLHPRLRKIFAEDLQVKNTKKVGKIDIYIDISGSMSSYCGVRNKDGNTISKIDFCKAFAAKLKAMDMLNDVYTFDNRVKKRKNDLISISMMDCGGGTTIDNAIQSIEKNGVNALVITDAEDSCSIYSDKAFFIGVEGARFNYFNAEIIKEYAEKGQALVFDGESINKVDEKGYIIK
jgi:hypothetical protein